MHRKIIHLDLDAFFCAVEELRDPTLRGKAFAVGGRPEERGVVVPIARGSTASTRPCR
jgi:DNA polymerase-4